MSKKISVIDLAKKRISNKTPDIEPNIDITPYVERLNLLIETIYDVPINTLRNNLIELVIDMEKPQILPKPEKNKIEEKTSINNNTTIKNTGKDTTIKNKSNQIKPSLIKPLNTTKDKQITSTPNPVSSTPKPISASSIPKPVSGIKPLSNTTNPDINKVYRLKDVK